MTSIQNPPCYTSTTHQGLPTYTVTENSGYSEYFAFFIGGESPSVCHAWKFQRNECFSGGKTFIRYHSARSLAEAAKAMRHEVFRLNIPPVRSKSCCTALNTAKNNKRNLKGDQTWLIDSVSDQLLPRFLNFFLGDHQYSTVGYFVRYQIKR